MLTSRGPIDPQLPGFSGGYDVSIPNLGTQEAPVAAAKLGLGDDATMRASVTNQRWDKFLFGGTQGHMFASASATDRGASGAGFRVAPGKNRDVPEALRGALTALDDAMRAFVAGRPANGAAAPADAANGYVLLKTRPIPVPLDNKPDAGIYVPLVAGDALSDGVRAATAAFTDALAAYDAAR